MSTPPSTTSRSGSELVYPFSHSLTVTGHPQSDSQLVSTLYRYHKKASPPNKLTSLYLVDGIAREARSRQKKLDREGKGKGREGAAQSPATPAVGSTTPTNSPPPAASPAPTAAAGTGSYASFLKILEGGMLAKFVVDNWENGLPEHRVRPRSLLRPFLRQQLTARMRS